MALAGALASRLRLPLIAAPMLRISGPELVIAACRAGVIGAFPTANARSVEQLDEWLTMMSTAGITTPYGANLIIRQPALADHVACLIEHRAEIVITSVGSPAPVVQPLHDIGALVLADVATLDHARKAVAAGVDGLVLLTAGAGGQTGWMNPFAFVRAVREFFDGTVVLAGGMSDGHALRAAISLGCDLGYMGTRFIATTESRASQEYRDMLVTSTIDDVMLTSAFTGLPCSMLRPAIRAAGLDPAQLNEQITAANATELYGGKTDHGGPRRWQDIFSAGHTVSAIERTSDVSDLIDQLALEFEAK
ncbi:NAD(P)H-dependent flavin oxidoreductase [Mycobacterium kyogaense]|uniref:NAD(P)H-dependent flavin oxidoreductase n=1 Tax=Mycobacterium kyogaense TaxID=2212479 RepID=UPI001968FD9F|nr:nitronate monooxygenase [Mycobacterium kyogaense]